MHHLRREPGFYKGALALMLPMMLQQFVTNFMALADSFMVGALGEVELAAVTMANTVFYVLSLAIFGIQSGMSVLVAQYNGRGNLDAINRVLGMGFYTSIAFTSIVSAATTAFPEQIMGVLTNNDALIIPGAQYMRIVGLSYVCMSVSGVYIAVQRSMENPKLGAYLLTVSGAMNIVLNYMFIFGKWGAPFLGCAGAAVATLISRAFEVVVILIFASRSRLLPLNLKLSVRPGKAIARDFMKYSLPVIMNEGLWSLAVSLYSIVMGHMANNTPILAAYTIAGNIDRLMAVGLFAAGNATAIIIGRDIGRGDHESLRSKAIALNFLCVGTGICSSLFLLLVRAFAADVFIFPMMNISPEAGELAKYMLLIIAIMMPLRASNLCNVVGVFRAGGDVRYALICDVLPMYAFTLPLTALMALVFGQSIYIVYVCTVLDDLFKIFLCVPRLRSGKWINDVTRDKIA